MAPISSKLLVAAASSIAVASCFTDNVSGQTILEVASTTPSLSTLVALVESEGMETVAGVLTDEADKTVFAPSNDGFNSLLQAYEKLDTSSEKTFKLSRNGEDKWVSIIGDVLKYHVIAGEQNFLADLTDDDYVTVLGENDKLTRVQILDALLDETDQGTLAEDGVVHLLDSVLVPNFFSKTIVDFVAFYAGSEGELTTLLDLVVLRPDILLALSGTDEITVFAPTNAAFEALGSAAGYVQYTHNADILDAILTSHVVPSVVESDDFIALADTDKITMLSGAEIEKSTINVVPELLDITADGYVDQIAHVVSSVIIPPNVLPSGASLVDVATSAGLTSLLAAATKAELAGALSTIDADTVFTVFAPTNEAFTAFLDGTPLEDIAKETLVEVLSRHVIVGLALSSDVETKEYETLAGEKVNVVVSDSGVTVNGVSVTIPDNRAWNGVAHVVDAVILKATPSPTDSESAASGLKLASLFSSFVAAASFMLMLN